MNKKLSFIFLILSLLVKSQMAKNYLNLPNPITLNDTEYFLDWSKQASSTLFLQQYLLKDQDINQFTEMVNVSYFDKEIDLEDAVRQKVSSFQKRESSDKFSKVQVTESPDKSEYIVDGLLTKIPKNGQSYAEYGIYRFKTYNTNGKKSFLIFAYIKRNYGDIKSAAKSLEKQRSALMNMMITYQIPPINLQETAPEN